MTRPLQRIAIRISGLVQGVGFRPYVYRLADTAFTTVPLFDGFMKRVMPNF